MSDDEAPAGKAESSVNVFGIMEDVNDKLKILNYETKFCRTKNLKPITGLYFSLPGKPSEQFPYFSSLCGWLLKESDTAEFAEWNEFDDPNTISNSIMDQLRRRGFKADFPATKLRHGSGDAVCLVLGYLVDQVLKKRNWAVKSPDYVKKVFVEEALADEGAVEEAATAEIEDDVVENEAAAFTEHDYLQDKKGDKDDDDKKDMAILEATVDPAEWNLELERVGPRLKFKSDGESSKEWRTHIEQSQKHEQSITEAFPDTKASLEKIAKELKEAIDRIEKKEQNINKDFEHLGGEFREKQKKLDEIQEKYNEISTSVSEFNKDLAEKSERVDQLKAQMSEQNNNMTDTSPLKRIRDALIELRREVGLLELRIGVVAQTLLQAKLQHQIQTQNAAIKAGKEKSDAY